MSGNVSAKHHSTNQTNAARKKGAKSPPKKAKYFTAIFRSNENCGHRTHFGQSALTRTAASKQPFALLLGGCAGSGCGHCAAQLVGLAAVLS
jgi:hypothetical protein